MTPALLLALAAAGCGAAAIVELAALAGAAARARASAPPRLHPGARLLAALGRGVGAPAPTRDLAARLAAAGLAGRVDVGEAMALKAGGAAAALLLAVPAAAAAPGRLGPVVLAGLPAAAHLAPDRWLARRARRRGRAMAAELPDVLDLLLIATGAGLPPGRAVAEVGRRRRGPLAAELRVAAGRAALGAPWEAVLDDLERRAPAEGVPALVAALRRAHRHGAPLGPVLRALAADARGRRAAAVREHAARAAPQIQLAVALLLVPASMLLLAAALLPALGR